MFKNIISLIEAEQPVVRQKTRNTLGLGVIFAMLVTSCATTTNISSVWKDQLYQVKPHKIMIIGIALKPANKRTLEDEFEKQISALGTQAVSSYTILPDSKDTNKEVIAEKMKELGADAVLITRIASRETVYNSVPGVYSPPAYYGSWKNYYANGYTNMYSPGYVEETKYAIMETNIYDAGNDKLIWSASSETNISGSDQRFIKSYVTVIVEKMVQQKLLQ